MDITLVITTYGTVNTTLKDISPSLVPSSACQRRTFSYITQLLSLLGVISSNYHWSVVKKGGPAPVPPDNDLISVIFRTCAEAGARIDNMQTSCCNDTVMSTVATDIKDATSGQANHSERICILAF